MTDTMTEAEFEAAFAAAQELSEYFREIGPECDTKNKFPRQSIARFKKSGLVGLNTPKEYGGLGADLLQTSKIVSELSRGDSAITLAYNMHYIMVGMCLGLFSDAQKKEWLGRVGNDNEIVFGPFSEQRAGFSGLADMTAVPQPEGGWRLYGKKVWGTLSEAANIVTTNATITDAAGNLPDTFEERVEQESFFVAEFKLDRSLKGDGVRVERTWDALGMHATGTHTVHFEGLYVPEDGFVCEWRSGAFGVLEWASLMFASVYLGMQYRVLEESRAVLAKKTLGATFGAVAAAETKVANVGHIIDGIGDMASRAEISRRVLYRTCQEVAEGDDDNWPVELRFPYIGLAKTFIADNVLHMTKHAMSMVGGSSFKKGAIFERLYRDSAASMFQPLNADQSRTFIGEQLLAPEELED